MTNKAGALRDLLGSLFLGEELHPFIVEVDETVAAIVKWDQAWSFVTGDVVPALQRFGVVDAAFFTKLANRRPARKSEISEVQALWSGGPSTATELEGAEARLEYLLTLRSRLMERSYSTTGVDDAIEEVGRRLRLGPGLEVGALIRNRYRLVELLSLSAGYSSWRAWDEHRRSMVRLVLTRYLRGLMPDMKTSPLSGLKHPASWRFSKR